MALTYEAGIIAGRRQVADKLSGLLLYEAHEPAEEGEEYTYLGSYILNWGKETRPSVGFRQFDWQALLKVK